MIGSMGTEYAFGYEKKPSEWMVDLAKEVMHVGKEKVKKKKRRGWPRYEATSEAYLKRRGTDKTTKRQSRAHQVKFLPYCVMV